MQVIKVKRRRGQIEFGIICGVIALLVLAAARFLPVLAMAPSCAFKALTGLPCPTCGSTRSIVHLAHADLISAMSMNPLICTVFLAAVPVLLYCIVTLVFDRPRIRFTLSNEEKNFFRICAFVIVLSNWLYLLFAL
jgi:hypothetical protein